jgi:hypothetical protein
MDPAALRDRAGHLGGRRLQAFMSVRDHQLDTGEAASVQGSKKIRPESLGFGRADRQAPSVLGPTTTIAAL